jgi:hypothetical protein
VEVCTDFEEQGMAYENHFQPPVMRITESKHAELIFARKNRFVY